MHHASIHTIEIYSPGSPKGRLEALATHMATLALACGLLLAVSAPAAVRAEPGASLYTRLGGYDFIAKFVDTAFPRVAGHPQLRRLFQGHSRDSQVRQRQLIVDALCQAAGGPCLYVGRALKPVHTGLGITASDWTAFIGVLGGALEELKVQPAERKEFLDLLERRFKPDVVENP